jgi:hypothetical protein
MWLFSHALLYNFQNPAGINKTFQIYQAPNTRKPPEETLDYKTINGILKPKIKQHIKFLINDDTGNIENT